MLLRFFHLHIDFFILLLQIIYGCLENVVCTEMAVQSAAKAFNPELEQSFSETIGLS